MNRHTAVIRLTIPRDGIDTSWVPRVKRCWPRSPRTGCRPLARGSRMMASEVPKATVARTIHHGRYEDPGASSGEFRQL